jgi:hypothetical protein
VFEDLACGDVQVAGIAAGRSKKRVLARERTRDGTREEDISVEQRGGHQRSHPRRDKEHLAEETT